MFVFVVVLRMTKLDLYSIQEFRQLVADHPSTVLSDTTNSTILIPIAFVGSVICVLEMLCCVVANFQNYKSI